MRLRIWLPAMPAWTEWISHPAISSASSTARWMDWTVDSMSTTTPFFRPRDGMGADADDLDLVIVLQFAHQAGDLGGADIQAHQQVFVVTS